MWQVKKGVVNGSEVMVPVSPEWSTFYRDDDPSEPMTSFEFDSLKEHTSYEVEMKARNSKGWSAANQAFVFTTSYGQHNCIVRRDYCHHHYYHHYLSLIKQIDKTQPYKAYRIT